MYTLPQEIEVWYVIPAIRKEISTFLVKEHGLSYDKIGKLLGISKAAVSQYIKKKRASKLYLHKNVLPEIEKSCTSMINKESNAVSEIQRILDFIRINKLPSEICDSYTKGLPEDCKEIYISHLDEKDKIF